MSGAFVFVILAAVTAATVGWFHRRQIKQSQTRRWGEQLRREIEDAGGVRAWKRKHRRTAPAAPVLDNPILTFNKHPLAGSLPTASGVWKVSVVTDEDDGRTRRFTLRLSPAHAEPEEAATFVVRVPRAVIETERPHTWVADLRQQLVEWINALSVIDRGEMIWWPVLPPEPPARDHP